METKINKIQTAIFTKNFNVVNDAERAQLLLDINTHSAGIFNASPVQIPIPNDAPLEFPRIILNSTDGRFSCNISLIRSDVFFNVPNDSAQNLDDLLQIQKTNSENIFGFLASKGIINRVGFIVVAEKTLDTADSNGNDYLKNNFIKDGRLNNPKELVIRYNQAAHYDTFEMNGLITITGKLNNKLVIQTDVNTAAELMNSANFNAANFNEIIDYAIQRTQELIGNFPNI